MMAKLPRIGQLRDLVTIEQATTTQAADGYPAPTWSTLQADVPAEVLTRSVAEGLRGQQVDPTATHLVTVRYRDDVTAEQRLAWGTRTLNVIGTRDADGRRRFLTIDCREDR